MTAPGIRSARPPRALSVIGASSAAPQPASVATARPAPSSGRTPLGGVLGARDRRRLENARAAVEVAAIHRYTAELWEETIGVPGFPVPPSFAAAARDYRFDLHAHALFIQGCAPAARPLPS